MQKLSDYEMTAEAEEHRGLHHNTTRMRASHGEIPMDRIPTNDYRVFKQSDLDKLVKTAAMRVKAER